MMKILLFLTLVIFVNSYSESYSDTFVSPNGLVEFTTDTKDLIVHNISENDAKIKSLKITWDGGKIEMNNFSICGRYTNGNFSIGGNAQNFFNPITMEWENSKKEKFTQEFTLKYDDAVKINKEGQNLKLVIFFTQNGAEHYISDNPKVKKMESVISKKQEEKCRLDNIKVHSYK